MYLNGEFPRVVTQGACFTPYRPWVQVASPSPKSRLSSCCCEWGDKLGNRARGRKTYPSICTGWLFFHSADAIDMLDSSSETAGSGSRPLGDIDVHKLKQAATISSIDGNASP